MRSNLILILFLLISLSVFGQVKDYEIGTSAIDRTARQGGLYDYSDPSSVNMKVAVWGFMKYAGRYIVPVNTTVADLLSFAGGPSDDANLEDIRLYRVLPDSTQIMIKIDYNDLLWESRLERRKISVPELKGGDILLVPGAPRLYFKDWFSITLSVISTLISLSILIINIVKN
jgi:polysaccharide biosynthesis/export protein